jgi:hypothetical protein
MTTASQSTTATRAISKTTIIASSPNPSLVGQGVTVAFTVTGIGSPTGTVTVSDGTGDSCTAQVPQVSPSCSLSFTTAGAKTLTASYGGDNNFVGSSSTSGSQNVNKGNTTIAITGLSPTSSVAGQAVTVSFAVAVVPPASGPLSGSVTVSDGVGDTCTTSVSSGTCSMIFASAGTKTVTAGYSGNANFNSSASSGARQNVIDFSISAKPPAQTIKAGQRTSYNTTLTPLNGFAGNVSVLCNGAPAGTTCTVQPNTATLNGSGQMTLTIWVQTSKSTPTGNYTLTLVGIFGSGVATTGGLTHTATFVLTLQQ